MTWGVRMGWQGALVAVLLMALIGESRAELAIPLGESGEQLDVRVIEPPGGASADSPLVLWVVNQYGDTAGPDSVAHALARRGATVWMVDVMDSLFLPRSDVNVRNVDGKPVGSLIQRAVEEDRPTVVVAADRMAVPTLRGMRWWQQRTNDPDALAGTVLIFPSLYRGAPVAGEEPELFSIIDATNLPVMLFQPERGVYRHRLLDLRERFLRAGSDLFVQVIPGVRDYYHMHLDEPQLDSLDRLETVMEDPAEVRAVQALPGDILRSIPLLAGADHPSRVHPIDPERTTPVDRQTGLQPVEPQEAPDFELTDLEGNPQSLDPDFDGVQIVNFWATWCPACVEEIPSMERLASRYPDQLKIYAIAFKQSPEHLREFMQDFDVSFPVPVDPDGKVAAKYDAFAFPSSFLVAADGRIHYSVNAGIIWDTEEVDAIVREMLAIEKD
ncbi:TlpA disulfide reductase family protein [Guyparkeria sp. GHLCS8-2]|uniref:TlpA family protein disulfide reductase n=1 Tax=Guyparkeria halopsychrophila TaxID=3139421 RepID=UPI0037CA6685